MRTEYVSTDQLKPGDVVLVHGMRLILGPNTSRFADVYRFPGQVQNIDEDIDPFITTILHSSYWSDETNQWESVYSGVWTIQGNELARWTREVQS